VTVEHAGTEADPFTVADALVLVDALANGATTSETYYVKGVVVGTPDIQKKDDGTFYGNANFDIADDANGSTLTAYRLKGLENSNIESSDYIKEGDAVILKGQLQKYVKGDTVTPEIKNGYIYSLTSVPTGINAAKVANKAAVIYNAAGQLLSAPQKGVNIIDGKKIMVK